MKGDWPTSSRRENEELNSCRQEALQLTDYDWHVAARVVAAVLYSTESGGSRIYELSMNDFLSSDTTKKYRIAL